MKQFVQFCLVGTTGLFVDMGVLYVLSDSRILGLSAPLAKAFAVEVAIVNNFAWNELWTFRELTIDKRDWSMRLRRFGRFNLICLIGLILGVIAIAIFHGRFDMKLYAANLIAIACTTFWNFGMNCRFSWGLDLAALHSAGDGRVHQKFSWWLMRNRLFSSCLALCERIDGLRRGLSNSEWLGVGILYLSLLPFLFRIDSQVHGDVALYYETIMATFSGELPYRDRIFEYPPYALIWFLVPALGGSLANFQFLFAMEILATDMLVKFFLLMEGQRWAPGLKGLLPLTTYSVGVGFINFFYLQRLDLIPAALSLLALWAFCRKLFFFSGLILSLGAGTKLFPALFGLPLLVLAWRSGVGKRFLGGCVAGVAPILLVSVMIPWWRFLAFHTERGFEVESLYASILWLLNSFLDLRLEWTWVRAWEEVKGPYDAVLVPLAKLVMMLTVAGSIIMLSWHFAKRQASKPTLAELARAMLVPLLPFVAFNIVLSPQYMIWLLALGSVGLMQGIFAAGPGSLQTRLPLRNNTEPVLYLPPLWLALATAVTPVWYPSPEFSSGFNLLQTLLVLGRNLLLIVLWIALLKRLVVMNRAAAFEQKAASSAHTRQ